MLPILPGPPMRRLLLPLLPCLLSAQATQEPARIQAFQATAKSVRRGEAVTLRWSATGADHVRLDPLGLILPAKGEITQMVSARMVYWLHVVNASGGQSLPLVVELLPETPVPAVPPVAAPMLPAAPPAPVRTAPLQQPAAPEDRPKLAGMKPPQPRALPASQPAAHREARRPGQRRAWIQFAAMVSPRAVTRLQRSLQRVASADSIVLVRHRHAGRPFQLVRGGPFPTLHEARLRLRELGPAMRALGLRPIILVGPPQPINPGATLIADSRQAP